MEQEIGGQHRVKPESVDSSLPPNRLSVDMPLGLGLSLGQDMEALSFFGSLPDRTKGQIIAYVQSTNTGEEAKARIQKAAECLGKRDLSFLS